MLALLIIISTIVLFMASQKLYVKVNHPLLLPLLTVTFITVTILASI